MCPFYLIYYILIHKIIAKGESLLVCMQYIKYILTAIFSILIVFHLVFYENHIISSLFREEVQTFWKIIYYMQFLNYNMCRYMLALRYKFFVYSESLVDNTEHRDETMA